MKRNYYIQNIKNMTIFKYNLPNYLTDKKFNILNYYWTNLMNIQQFKKHKTDQNINKITKL